MLCVNTDPTYKEWKQNQSIEILRIQIKNTDPTYKEWKLFGAYCNAVGGIAHGSYLQGMETWYRPS